MEQNFVRTEVGEGVYLTSIIDQKFKSNRISINFLAPLNEKTAAENALVPLLLRKGSKEHPDFTALNAYLDELYGAILYGDIRKLGDTQVLNLSLQCLDEAYVLEKEPIATMAMELLLSLLLHPMIEDGGFEKESFGQEKQYLADLIESEINDKRSYAINRMIQAMFQGKAYGVNKFGTKETVDALTPKQVASAYERLITTAPIEILYVGSKAPEAVTQVVKDAFSKVERQVVATKEELGTLAERAVQTETQHMQLSQGKLVMGFRTSLANDPKALDSLRVMIALFGGTPFSRLFANVREKMSLCYYCAARMDRYKRIMIVDSGVEHSNMEKAKAAILEQLEIVKRGEFEEEELQNTLLSLDNAFQSVSDSLHALEDWYLSQIYTGEYKSPLETMERIHKVTKADVVEAANSLTLDTVFALKGEEK